MQAVYHSPGNVKYPVTGWAYTITLRGHEPAMAMITQVYIIPQARGNGMAKNLLTQVTADADREGILLVLDFQPAEFNSDATRLQLFYERFGFTWDETIGGMRREPQT